MPKMTPYDAAVRIVRRLHDRGYEALLAGGCVRDVLLGREPDDYDVVTDARPQRIVRMFRLTRRVGVQFGVVLVRSGGHWIEVATFRTDLAYADGRHPTGVVFGTKEEDARRRDFTINGMFYDIRTQEVVDCVGGRQDLEAGLIRAIGEPAHRFAEDHLRLLRAVRFDARFNFRIEDETWRAIIEHASSIRRTSAERVRDELAMMLEHPNRVRALELLRRTGLLDHLWADVRFDDAESKSAERLLTLLGDPVCFETGLACLLHARKPAEADHLCRRLALSNRSRLFVVWLLRETGRLVAGYRPQLYELKGLMTGPAFDDFLRFFRARLAAANAPSAPADELFERATAVPPEAVDPPPLLTGDDLLRLGVPAGPALGRILDRVRIAQLNEEIASPDDALTLAQALIRGDPA